MSGAWHRTWPREPSDARAKIRRVTDETRSQRTERLLVARLEAVGRVASELRHAEVERLVELASVATMRAVALELIRAETAAAIWREAHGRHPALPYVEIVLPQRLAA
jgi:hypothetical protein